MTLLPERANSRNKSISVQDGADGSWLWLGQDNRINHSKRLRKYLILLMRVVVFSRVT